MKGKLSLKIIDKSAYLEPEAGISGTEHFSSGTAPASKGAAAECFVSVSINGVKAMRLVCSPANIPEMVLGRLFTEGMISSPAEVLHITVCETGREVSVQLNRQPGEKSEAFIDTTGSCCTGNHLLTDAFASDAPPARLPDAEFEDEWIFSLARKFEEEPSRLFLDTHSVHSCYLSRRGEILYICEDLGRHNAMDKAIGCALRDGVDLSECILFSSGRLPTDMIAKAIRAGIPILCSKSVCTDKGAELASRFNMTPIVYAKSSSFIVVE